MRATATACTAARRQWLACLAFATVCGLSMVAADEAKALRPGGGSSYRGESPSDADRESTSSRSDGSSERSSDDWSDDSSSSGNGSGPPLYVAVMIFASVSITIAIVYFSLGTQGGWASAAPKLVIPQVKPKPVRLDILRTHDPTFSQILLEDFLYELYIHAQEARGSKESLALLAPYLNSAARASLGSRGQRKVLNVSGVIVGSMRVTTLKLFDGQTNVNVEYETNYTESYSGEISEEKLDFYATERWHFVRKLSARSRAPNETRGFGCPSCGAPVEQNEQDTCSHCGAKHGTGEFDWLCDRIELQHEECRPPTLGGYAPEEGTNDPSIRADDVDGNLDALMKIDPGFDSTRFMARVDQIYHVLNDAWSSLQWQAARPYLSDRLWFSMRYWIHAYEKQSLQNQMVDAKVERKELAKVVFDPFFHAITVRIWASALDTTIHRKTGVRVGGDPLMPRKYSEYWTVIRSAERRGPASTDAQCPNCGAPLLINMAGNCDHCGVKITAGQFDWVLSKIEQDEAYRG